MKWQDLQTEKFRKLDLRMEKVADMRVLRRLLHDAQFDFHKIRYDRRRLVIPLFRYPEEWTNGRLHPICLVNGELILYPVIHPCDWQITLSGEWLGRPEKLQDIVIVDAGLTQKTDTANSLPPEYRETWYHFRLVLSNRMLPCYMDVLLRSWKDFPLIRFRDISIPCDHEAREPIHLQYHKPVSK